MLAVDLIHNFHSSSTFNYLLIYKLAPTLTVGHYYNSPYKRSPPDLFEDVLRFFFLRKIHASDPPNSGLHLACLPLKSDEALEEDPQDDPQDDPQEDPQDDPQDDPEVLPLP